MAEEKKNVIPLVLAVVLALAAVFAVHRFTQGKDRSRNEDRVKVLVTARALKEGDVINEGALNVKEILLRDAPPHVIAATREMTVRNQKLVYDLPAGAYLTSDAIVQGTGLSDMIHEGEWAVSITLNGGAITSRLRPGDEIAIVGTFNFNVVKGQKTDFQEEDKTKEELVTLVILPRVRILALDGNRQQGGDEFVLALPPEQAQALLSAQAHGVELSPALRRPHDPQNLKRSSLGRIEDLTFTSLGNNCETVMLPDEVPEN